MDARVYQFYSRHSLCYLLNLMDMDQKKVPRIFRGTFFLKEVLTYF